MNNPRQQGHKTSPGFVYFNNDEKSPPEKKECTGYISFDDSNQESPSNNWNKDSFRTSNTQNQVSPQNHPYSCNFNSPNRASTNRFSPKYQGANRGGFRGRGSPRGFLSPPFQNNHNRNSNNFYGKSFSPNKFGSGGQGGQWAKRGGGGFNKRGRGFHKKQVNIISTQNKNNCFWFV